MSNPFRVVYKCAYSGSFLTQSAIGTPLANADIDTAFSFVEGGQGYMEIVERTEAVTDCTTEYPADDILLNRHGRLTLRIEVDETVLTGLFKWWGGKSSSSPYRMLGPTEFDLPATTLMVGFADGVDTGMVFKDVGIESLTITGQVNQKFQTTVVFVGNGSLPNGSGYTFPDCTAISPIRLSTTTHLLMNSVDYIDILRSFELALVNNIPMTDFPFPLASVDLSRLIRGIKRNITLKAKILGRENDSNGLAARANPRTHWPVTLQIGGLAFEMADAIIKQGSPFGDSADEVNQAAINLLAEPTRLPGDASTPLQLTVS